MTLACTVDGTFKSKDCGCCCCYYYYYYYYYY